MSEIVIYQNLDGNVQLQVQIDNDTVWLSQAQLVQLFARERTVIIKHINNIFRENELDEKSNVQKMHIAKFAIKTILSTTGFSSVVQKNHINATTLGRS